MGGTCVSTAHREFVPTSIETIPFEVISKIAIISTAVA
jgi:hypothetical protein